MSIKALIQKLSVEPEAVGFDEVINVIDEHYHFTPTAFTNGELDNAAGQNSGSCKIFAFARIHGLSQQQTLACFGRFYREDVLAHPEAVDHQNIRQFMAQGWSGVNFSESPLQQK